MTLRLALGFSVLLSACGGAQSSGASAGPPVSSASTTSASAGSGAGAATAASAGAAGAATDRPCCVPSGVEDPADPYGQCVRAGGRPWGTDGCGVREDGTIVAPPPSMDPG